MSREDLSHIIYCAVNIVSDTLSSLNQMLHLTDSKDAHMIMPTDPPTKASYVKRSPPRPSPFMHCRGESWSL